MRSPDDRSGKELTLAAAGFEDPGLFAVLEHAAETPERYDDLTFGLVAVQHDGTVFAYGAVEAKYSGISPARVLGRNFFTDVAPCCNNFMVSGRFDEEPDLDVIIDYVFTLKMRPTHVELRLLRSSTSPRQYVAIRRRS